MIVVAAPDYPPIVVMNLRSWAFGANEVNRFISRLESEYRDKRKQ